MIEITPRFAPPLDLPRGKGDLGASEFQHALKESDTRGPDGQRQGTVRPQSQFVYADPNGTSGTGQGTSGTNGTGQGTSGTNGTGQGTSGTNGTGQGTSGTNGTASPIVAQADVKTAPNSQKRPELEKIAKDPVVSAEIDKSWTASNPNGPGAKKEKGFWVTKDDKSGALSVTQFPDNGTNDSLTPGAKPSEPGKTVVAFFHTHPNTGEEGYTSGPSPDDEKFAKAVGVPGIIRSHDGMYYFGPK